MTSIHEPKYIPELDGIRGISVLLVLLVHVHAIRGGHIGVDIFFVLSGFLITGIIRGQVIKTGSMKFGQFYFRRFVRLYPALLLATALFACFALIQDRAGVLAQISAKLLYLVNWLVGLHVMPDFEMGHTWSLSIEAQFYLVWPILLVWITRSLSIRQALILIGAAVLMCAAWRSYLTLSYGAPSLDRTYRGLDTRADALLVGACLSFVAGYGSRWLQITLGWVGAVSLAIVALTVREGTLWMHSFGFTLVAIAAACLIYAVTSRTDNPLKRLLTFAPLMYVGTISYGIYLYHFPILQALRAWGVPKPGVIGFGIAASFIVAALSFHLVEKPLLMRTATQPRPLPVPA